MDIGYYYEPCRLSSYFTSPDACRQEKDTSYVGLRQMRHTMLHITSFILTYSLAYMRNNSEYSKLKKGEFGAGVPRIIIAQF
jgi:hypothetical protein